MGEEKVSEEKLQTLYWAAGSSSGQSADDFYSKGMSESEYQKRCLAITSLEYFMHSLPNAAVLSDFPNVVELAVHLESVPRIVGLHTMTKLQRLCMTECGLQSMEGLRSCVQLTHLDLSHNEMGAVPP